MANAQSRVVAFIPARSGSKRVTDKNVRRLGGHPMMAYTIAAALESGVFTDVVVSTDSEDYAAIARHYGAEVPFLRPPSLAGSTSPDIDFVEHVLDGLKDMGREYDCFSILRPTSPFRQPETIRRAWAAFMAEDGIDSLRAVEKCGQHPGKMWTISGPRMTPVLEGAIDGQPWHSSQYAALPEIYVQNASLEIAWTRVVYDGRTIAGTEIMPFLTKDLEGFDINSPEDWWHAEHLIETKQAQLPSIGIAPYSDS